MLENIAVAVTQRTNGLDISELAGSFAATFQSPGHGQTTATASALFEAAVRDTITSICYSDGCSDTELSILR
jgi:hypothetical protein